MSTKTAMIAPMITKVFALRERCRHHPKNAAMKAGD